MTHSRAKKIIAKFLDERKLFYVKLTAKKVGFTDLARGDVIFVTIHGWRPNPATADVTKLARENGFRVEFKNINMIS